MSMKPETKKALISYITALMNNDGMTAIHVMQIIPPVNKSTSTRWTSFVDLDPNDIPPGITYDKPSGWFRKT